MNDPLRAQQMVRRQVRRRRRWNRARLAALVLLSTAAVLAAAYGIDRLAVVVHHFYAEHHHSGHHVASGTTSSTDSTTSTVPGPARCGTPQLAAEVSDWRELDATVEEVVTVTNISASPCTVAGYPVVGVGAQNGTPLPAPNVDLSLVGVPGAATSALPTTTVATGAPVVLTHGQRASFELSYGTTCSHILAAGQAATGAPGECYSGQFLEVIPTTGASPLIVTPPIHVSYVTSGLEVSPFQAGDGPALGAPVPSATTTPPTTAPAGPQPTP